MTEEIYNECAETVSFDAETVSCRESGREGVYELVLDRTAFFPEQGGQYADRGTIAGEDGIPVPVTDAKMREGDVIHYVSRAFRPGEKVHGEVDWADRYDKMQQHTAEHIVSGIICSAFGCDNVGFTLGPDHMHADYSVPLTADQIREAELRANEAVWKNLPVEISWPDEEELKHLAYRSKKEIEGRVRIVTIPGIDVCACCAPHLRRTGEIGLIRIVSAEKYKGGTRVLILAGKRAYRYDSLMIGALNRTARDLSVKAEAVPESVAKLKEENSQLRYENRGMLQKLLKAKIAEASGEKNPVIFGQGLDMTMMQHAADELMQGKSGIGGIFSGNDSDGYLFVIFSSQADCRQIAASVRAELGGKGGGRNPMIQGSIPASEKSIRCWFEKIVRSAEA